MRRAAIHFLVLMLLPWVTWWAWRMERKILRTGRILSATERDRARSVGVQNPGHIRVAVVPAVPMPGWRWMQRLAARIGFDGSQTSGMALRYGIFVRAACATDSRLLLHECAHTAQYERIGSLSGFLRRYLVECIRDGYANSALEREAADRALQAGG